MSAKIIVSLTGLEARALFAAAAELTGWEGPPMFPWGLTGRERQAMIRARDKLLAVVPPPRQGAA